MSGKHIELGDATLAPFFKGLKTLHAEGGVK
jgi:hypothetical protein